jgi:hypothetical protein
MKKTLLRLIMLVLFAAGSTELLAQNKQLFVKHDNADENQPLTVTIETPKNYSVTKALVFYRNPISSGYRQIEAMPQGNSFIATIPGKDVVAPSVEYYVKAILLDNSQVTFPEVAPAQSPVSVTVKPKQQSSEIIMISPGAGEEMEASEALISFSYYTLSDQVDLKSAKLIVDGKDVTKDAIVSENMITYLPESFGSGKHQISFAISDKNGKSLGSVSNIISTRSFSTVSESKTEPIRYTSQSWAELRNETIADSSIFYGRLSTTFDASYKWLGLRGFLYLTTEEESDRQTSNRYSIRATTPYLDASYGDIFPDYNYYVANGLRIRGYEVNGHLGFLHLDVIQGTTAREVNPKLGATSTILTANTDSASALINLGYVLTDSTTTNKTYRQLLRSGTFKREIFTARAGINSEIVQFDLQYLKAKDQVGEFNYYGVEPQENVAIGSSFRVSPWPQRVDFFADAALSSTNTDVTGGSLTNKEFSDLIGQEFNKKMYDAFNKVITLNQNLSPLNPLDMSSLTYRFGTNLNISTNYFRFEYLRQGEAYQSFGLSYYQPDVKGFRIFDRLRLLDNKVFLALSFERLTDNLNNRKDVVTRLDETLSGTTTRTMLKGSVSWFPGQNLPNLRFDYTYQGNSNDFPDVYRDSTSQNTIGAFSGLGKQTDNTTNTITFDASQMFSIGRDKILTLGLTTTFSNRSDNRDFSFPAKTAGGQTISYASSDTGAVPQEMTNRAIILSSSLSFPSALRFNISLSNIQSEYFINTTEKSKQDFYTLDMGIGYGFFDNKLRPSARASLTFGDFKRTILGVATTYDINQSMSLTGDLNFLFVGKIPESGLDKSTDMIASVRYQVMFGN